MTRHVIQLRLTADERSKIERLAAAADVTLSKFCRQRVLGSIDKRKYARRRKVVCEQEAEASAHHGNDRSSQEGVSERDGETGAQTETFSSGTDIEAFQPAAQEGCGGVAGPVDISRVNASYVLEAPQIVQEVSGDEQARKTSESDVADRQLRSEPREAAIVAGPSAPGSAVQDLDVVVLASVEPNISAHQPFGARQQVPSSRGGNGMDASLCFRCKRIGRASCPDCLASKADF
jgi:hypothetical protein